MNDGSADGWTDRWMDTQNFGRYNIIPSPLFVAGHKLYIHENLIRIQSLVHKKLCNKKVLC